MIDEYIDEQKIIYKVLTNSVFNDRVSHAYLFDLNGYNKGMNLALAFAKFLMCPNNYTNNLCCKNCSQCEKIDSKNFTEIKIIEPDGQWIKKEQLEELQKEFMTKSFVGNKKIYIINDAEKMNVSASNSLLKFLEEPPEGIVAILLTNNIYQLLNTIISRCQVLSFMKPAMENSINKSSIEKIGEYFCNEKSEYEKFISEDATKYIDEIIEYVNFLEKNKEETIIYKNKYFLEVFNDRRKILIAFDLFVLYYKDVLNYLLGVNCEYFFDYIDSISFVATKNTLKNLSTKIQIISNLAINIKYNLNSNLLMDKFVILLSEV